jgi:transcriptional regulator with XRE-family HTH domain
MATQLQPDEAFIAELKRWRDIRGLPQTGLAALVGYTPSYISKVEGGRQHPSAAFAAAADRELRAGGAILRAYGDLGPRTPTAHAAAPENGAGDTHATSLIVEHEDTTLHYDGHTSTGPPSAAGSTTTAPTRSTRYLIRISVDRYPGDPERSNPTSGKTR